MKYDLRAIMTQAHKIRKESIVNCEANIKALRKAKGMTPERLAAKFKPITMSEALKQAWAGAKRDAMYVAPTAADQLFILRMKDSRWTEEDRALEAELVRRVAVA